MIKIIDDIISKPYQDLIEQELMYREFPWFFVDDLTIADSERQASMLNTAVPKTPGFTHVFFDSTKNWTQNPRWNLVLPLIIEATAKAGIRIEQIYQGRTFMHLPIVKHKPWDNPHVDYDFPHLACLYYVNDSDGDTYLFDQTTADVPWGPTVPSTNFTVKQTVTPKKGRMVLFDGSRYHASSIPTIGPRCIINFDIKV